MLEMGVNTDTMIQVGISKSRKSGTAFLPAPGAFCKMCLPGVEDYGMPTLSMAFKEARDKAGMSQNLRKWSHQAVYLAAASTGFFGLKSCVDGTHEARELRSLFKEHYERLTEKVMNGEELTVAPENRIEKTKFVATKQQKREAEIARESVLSILSEL